MRASAGALLLGLWPTLSLALGPPSEDVHTVWVIGDLHADIFCAKSWVRRTGLVANLDRSSAEWTWTADGAHLTFMGDYIDKGPHAKAVVEFVKSLTDAFPDKVHAIMGNHELNLLVDRSRRHHQHMYLQLAYGAAHPGQYAGWLHEGAAQDSTFKAVEDALYEALVTVYGKGLHAEVKLSPKWTGYSILQYVAKPRREVVAEELAKWQDAYLAGVATGSALGTWLEQRPLSLVLGDTLFVHGGVPLSMMEGPMAPLGSRAALADLNERFAAHASQDTIRSFLMDNPAATTLVEYRGLHGGGCEVDGVAKRLNVSRVIVGHTPKNTVRVSCDGKLVAVDSALGRWFRASGNLYCDGWRHRKTADGRPICEPIVTACEGEIARLTKGHDGSWVTDIIGMTPEAQEEADDPVHASALEEPVAEASGASTRARPVEEDMAGRHDEL